MSATRIGAALAERCAPSSPWPRGGAPIRSRSARRDAAGDEALDDALLVDDAEGRVARVGQLADAVDDELQDALEVQDAGDRPGRVVERRHPLDRLADLGPRPAGRQ